MVGFHGRGVAFLVLASLGVTSVARAEPEVAFKHVRSNDVAIRARLADGYRRSPTFRRLVDEIEALPGLVYVAVAVKLSQGMDGALLHSVSGSPQMPILRVLIRTGIAGDYAIGVLAHELQHVVEALRGGFAVSGAALGAFFATLDHQTTSPKFETEEARQVEARVLSELSLAPGSSCPRCPSADW